MYYENDLSFLFRETAITMKHSKGEQKCQHNSSTQRNHKDSHKISHPIGQDWQNKNEKKNKTAVIVEIDRMVLLQSTLNIKS